MPYIQNQIGKPPASYQGPLTAGPTQSWQRMREAIMGRTGTGLTDIENRIQNLINQRLQPGYNAMSNELEDALWGRAKDRVSQYFNEARNRQAEDYARRGLYQSGLLTGAQQKLGEQEGQQIRELARDIAIQGSQMTREDIANAMAMGQQLGNVQRQYQDAGLGQLWNLAQAEQAQAQQGVLAPYQEWIRQQQAAQIPIEQAMQLFAAMQPGSNLQFQGQLAQYQNSMQNQSDFWSGLGGLAGMWLPMMFPNAFPGFKM